jgi:colanic acid/amylovoran biosynthesis glycosyltransferase
MTDANDTTKPVALIYAEPLLAPSMTFVRSQGEALRSFVPYYVSPSYLSDGLSLPAERVVVMNRKADGVARIATLPFKLLGYAPRFVRRLHQLNPALLHAHFGPMGVRALPLARALKIPLIVTYHGYDATIPDELARKSKHYSHRAYARRRDELERESSLFIAVSDFVRDQLLRQGISPAKILVHYIGVDVEVFRPDPTIHREPSVLFAGRLEAVKGVDYLICAMAKVQSACPDATLLVIGDGSMRRQLERTARESLRKSRFLGFQPPEVVRHWMNRACIFAAPGVRTQAGAEEGLGLTLLEAQSMGLPVVGFASGGIPEAVMNRRTGLLSREHDTDALARDLTTLLRDHSLRVRMGGAARQHICRTFNLRSQTDALEGVYRQAVLQASSQPEPLVAVSASGGHHSRL